MHEQISRPLIYALVYYEYQKFIKYGNLGTIPFFPPNYFVANVCVLLQKRWVYCFNLQNTSLKHFYIDNIFN